MKKIAVIGAGPAGYTAAQELSKTGHAVTIFDKEAALGGAIYTGIPEYRMSKVFLDKVLQGLTADPNVTLQFNTLIDQAAFAKLRAEYDAVLLAPGAQVENTFGFETGKGIVAGLTLLYDLNIKKNHDAYKKYKKALVWGGGNVAMDCARSLIRILDDVTVIYRRSEEEITANKSEIRDAKKEGVKFDLLRNIKDIKHDDQGNVTGAEILKMELGEPDESGRRSPHPVEGSEYFLPADLVAMAIGQKVDLKVFDENLESGENHHTNEDRVFIAGDAYTGPKTIGSALIEGRAVAKEILADFNK
ncbi:FAD-dependent oxidoreductase [uncultured Megasphaera sp.]|uniref:FAD-dependent oxidoreductase n=1 Tax=uncultured Megasphaera sp. TaxID=165188 RepID=UPI0028697506|nr:FAD-dependent oxidoreductase [uncultured Megasphaera sp.]